MNKNFYMKHFANRLIELRTERGISARELSIKIGRSHNTIHNIESQKCFPSFPTFFLICEKLEITPSKFFENWCKID